MGDSILPVKASPASEIVINMIVQILKIVWVVSWSRVESSVRIVS